MWTSYQNTWQQIMETIHSKPWEEPMVTAFREYFGHESSLRSPPPNKELFRFYEWFVWDYRLPAGQSVMDELKIAPPAGFSPWHGIRIQVVQVIAKTRKDKLVRLGNVFDREEFLALPWSNDIDRGCVYCGRFLPLDSGSAIATPSLLEIPFHLFLFLQKRIQTAWHMYPGTAADFLRDQGRMVTVWLRELTGDQEYQSYALFEVHDYRAVLAGLREIEGMSRDQNHVLPLFGPLVLRWAGQGNARILVDEEELLLLTAPGTPLDQMEGLLGGGLDPHLDYIERQDGDSWNERMVELGNLFSWPREDDKDVARVLVDGMKESYHPQQIRSALQIWFDFTSKEQPAFRKPQIWAATVELAVRHIDAAVVRSSALEKKYAIGSGTLSKTFPRLQKSLKLIIGDNRYSSLRH